MLLPNLDPSPMILTSILVSLVTMPVLLLSPIATGQRASVRLWIAGDCIGIVSRLLALAGLNVPDRRGEEWLDGRGVDAASGALFVAVALFHGLALRSTLSQPARRRDVLAVLAGVAACAGVMLLMPHHRDAVLVSLLGIFACSAWTALLALPWRHQFRGALLVTVAMSLVGVVVASALFHLVVSVRPDVQRTPPWFAQLGDMLVSLTLTMGFLMTQFELLHQRIRHLSLTDPLTGALNRRGFVQRLHALDGGGAKPVSLAIFDLDHFKRINDTLGHACGDEVLTGFVERVRGVTRSTDVLGRWGGEEFVLLMPATDARGALRLVERARQAVADTPLAPAAPGVTVSAGLATGDAPLADGEADTLLARADASLYRAKEQRNCVVAWTGEFEDAPSPTPHVRRPGDLGTAAAG